MPRIRYVSTVLAYGVASLCLLAASGCGPSRHNIKGTIVLPPNVELKEGDAVSITFAPEERGAPVGSGTYSAADKSFIVLRDTEGHSGIPPGKYKIKIQLTPYPGPDADQRKATLDTINKSFGGDDTKLNYEVTGDSTQTITIDLTKGTVTKS